MILCEFYQEECKAIEFKKERIKAVHSVKRKDILQFMKRKRKEIKGILVNPQKFYYRSIERKFSPVVKNIVDYEFPDIKDGIWEKFDDKKGKIHLVMADSAEIEFAREIIKTSRAQCEILDLSIFNVVNFVTKFYEGFQNGVIINVAEDYVYSIFVKNKKSFWGNSYEIAKFPDFSKKQIYHIFSIDRDIQRDFKIYLNVASTSLTKEIGNIKESLGFDIVLIDPIGIAKNLRKLTEDIPSIYTGLIGLSLRIK